MAHTVSIPQVSYSTGYCITPPSIMGLKQPQVSGNSKIQRKIETKCIPGTNNTTNSNVDGQTTGKEDYKQIKHWKDLKKEKGTCSLTTKSTSCTFVMIDRNELCILTPWSLRRPLHNSGACPLFEVRIWPKEPLNDRNSFCTYDLTS